MSKQENMAYQVDGFPSPADELFYFPDIFCHKMLDIQIN